MVKKKIFLKNNDFLDTSNFERESFFFFIKTKDSSYYMVLGIVGIFLKNINKVVRRYCSVIVAIKNIKFISNVGMFLPVRWIIKQSCVTAWIVCPLELMYNIYQIRCLPCLVPFVNLCSYSLLPANFLY